MAVQLACVSLHWPQPKARTLTHTQVEGVLQAQLAGLATRLEQQQQQGGGALGG